MMLGHQQFPDEVNPATGLARARRQPTASSGEMISDHFMQLQGKMWIYIYGTKKEWSCFEGIMAFKKTFVE